VWSWAEGEGKRSWAPTWGKKEGKRTSAQRRKKEGAALAGPKSDRGRGAASSFIFLILFLQAILKTI
jgi:hypothetical protein